MREWLILLKSDGVPSMMNYSIMEMSAVRIIEESADKGKRLGLFS